MPGSTPILAAKKVNPTTELYSASGKLTRTDPDGRYAFELSFVFQEKRRCAAKMACGIWQ
ncbi:MAG: hypothetical protein CSA34_05260 [Desulfobulbus propionicus]|nr:MAG: hypothetical protein CSA34_05260 [Desulfobulbus propionicus]